MKTAIATRPLEAFTAVRPLLYSIAYRMLGSTMEAEDLVQERSEERRVGKECRSRWSPYH